MILVREYIIHLLLYKIEIQYLENIKSILFTIMPSPFAETYDSPAAVLFAANVCPIMLTQCIKEPEPTTVPKPSNRKVVARVKLPPIVILKHVSKL